MPLSCLSFASCFVYAPYGRGLVAEASRRLCRRVKGVDAHWLARYAGAVRELSGRDNALAALFARGAVLVPVPRSAPAPARCWPALQLALAIMALGLGGEVWSGLHREAAVRKSATAPRAARPTVPEHYESFAFRRPPATPKRIVLIDDVISRGRTLLAAAARLQVELPTADLRAFALIRTLGFAARIAHIIEPCHGVIRWQGDDADREP